MAVFLGSQDFVFHSFEARDEEEAWTANSGAPGTPLIITRATVSWGSPGIGIHRRRAAGLHQQILTMQCRRYVL